MVWWRTHKLSILLAFTNCLLLTYLLATKQSQNERIPLQPLSATLEQDTDEQLPERHRKIRHLPPSWVVLKDTGNTHHLVSAVFDDRTEAPLRPAVLVFGFVLKKEPENSKIYCLLHYNSPSDSSHGEEAEKECLREPAHINSDGQCRYTFEKSDARMVTYYCSIGYGMTPTEVQLSTDKGCRENLSYPLKVFYQKQSASYQGKVGVCLHSPLVGSDKNLKADLVNFVEMSRILGAESVTMYISNILDNNIRNLVKKMRSRRSKAEAEGGRGGGKEVDIELVQWHGFRLGAPLHYYGQSLLMLDCMYRHMYKVELLVFQDLDEMILPTQGDSWVDMVRKMDKKGRYASYQFLHNLFTPPQSNFEVATTNGSKQVTEPRYFKWTQRLDCSFPHGSRSKLIVRPDLMLVTCVHYVERTLVEKRKKTYRVPFKTGLLAHYRRTTIEKCKDSNMVLDDTALKYMQHFRKEHNNM